MKLYKIIYLLFIVFFFTNILFASETKKALNSKHIINLTKEEQLWIKTHNIKIGVEQWEPILFSNNGSDIDGICGDFTKLIIKRTGLKITIVNDEWNSLLINFCEKTKNENHFYFVNYYSYFFYCINNSVFPKAKIISSTC